MGNAATTKKGDSTESGELCTSTQLKIPLQPGNFPCYFRDLSLLCQGLFPALSEGKICCLI